VARRKPSLVESIDQPRGLAAPTDLKTLNGATDTLVDGVAGDAEPGSDLL
jgi:hypothetical protein